jgi:hypothetical protein
MDPLSPFALSLSKGCSFFFRGREDQDFDKLSPNGERLFYLAEPCLSRTIGRRIER